MLDPAATPTLPKLPTGIPGFDLIAHGGLPLGRTTLVAGTAGSGKTVFATQFLAEGIRQYDEPGVMVTFEEPATEIARNMASFGWPIDDWEREGRWSFVDVSRRSGEDTLVSGTFDFGALIARIEYAVQKTGARRISLDALDAVFSQFVDAPSVRFELFRIAQTLREMGLTAVLTAERQHEFGQVARAGVEEFVADNVVILRNVLEEEKRRRTIEILKFRGTFHQKGEFPFTVLPDRGVVVIPLSAVSLTQRSSDVRITSGNEQLDAMCGGGFFQDSIVLCSGATGTGKTLMSTMFMGGGAQLGERSMLFAFEESRDQLFRNAMGWNIDYRQHEANGTFRVMCDYPEARSLEDHLIAIKREIDQFKPKRVAIDSLSALERISTVRSYREFVISLTSYIKQHEIAGLFTSTSATLLGGASITETHISTITDSIILLRYVELFGEMRRGLTVLKMRGSMHDKDIREFTIDGTGIHIGKAFRGVSGILSGNFSNIHASEVERINALFDGQ
jgi:circadian clock protein KaiC